jgi:hypothetical protein
MKWDLREQYLNEDEAQFLQRSSINFDNVESFKKP